MKIIKVLILSLLLALGLFITSRVTTQSESPAKLIQATYNHTTRIGSGIAQEMKLEYVRTAACTKKYAIPYLSCVLTSQEEVVLEVARSKIKQFTAAFLFQILQIPDIHTLARTFASRQTAVFPIGFIGIRISFWDEKVRRRMPPLIAEVQFFEGAYHYYQSNEKQELVEIYSEPIEPLPFISSYEDMKYVPEGKTPDFPQFRINSLGEGHFWALQPDPYP